MKPKSKFRFSKKKFKVICLILAIVVAAGYATLIFLPIAWTGNLAAIVSSVLIDLTNKQRVDNQVAPLSVSPLLEKAAKLKVEDMAKRSYFAHMTPEGRNFTDFLNQVGYKYKYAGENLAFDFVNSEDVSRAWMQSPGHRANLLKNNYTEIGIASATGTLNGKEGIFVAQYFGTPALTN